MGVTGRFLFHLPEWVFVLASASQRNVDSAVIAVIANNG